jgi:hypothetical protein
MVLKSTGVGVHPDIVNQLLVSYIYWDPISNKASIFGDERHGSSRDTEWHKLHHLENGAVWLSGGEVEYVTNNDSDIGLGFTSPISIADEDLTHIITHSLTATDSDLLLQRIEKPASLTCLWYNGSYYRELAAVTGTFPNNGSSVYYNNPVAGTLVPASGTSYINYWVITTNDLRNPVKLLMGQKTHSNANNAANEQFESYDLPLPEMVPMYKVMLERKNTYTKNAARVVIYDVDRIVGRSSAISNIVSTSNHQSLSGRSLPNQHPQGSITGLDSDLHALRSFDSDLMGSSWDYGSF